MQQKSAFQELADAIRDIGSVLPSDAPSSADVDHLRKLANIYTEMVYKQAANEMPEDIEHPFRHYWSHRIGGAALGGLAGSLAGSAKGPVGQVVGGLAGAFVGERAGEAKALMDHYKTVATLERSGMQVPDSVRHPHYHGVPSHQAGVQAMKQTQLPLALGPGGF